MATIVKRGEYQYQATVRRLGYPTRTQTFISKRDAEAWARRTESEMERGLWKDTSAAETTSLGDIFKRYRLEVTPGKKGAEVEAMRLLRLEKNPLAKIRLSALSSMNLAAYRDERLKVVQSGTVNRELDTISAAINVARKDWGMQMDNPVEMIRRPKKPRGRDRRLEPVEEQQLLAALEGQRRADGTFGKGTRNPWIKPIVLLALETAMRRGELLSMEWKNVDLRRRFVHLQDTKNGDARNVPLSSSAVAVLEGLPRSISGKVFPITSNALKLAFDRACRTAGIEDFHFHDLRHEAASRLAEKLSNILELSAVTGHKDLKMLKRYYHPRAEDLARKLG